MPEVGDNLGRYTLLRRLAVGGMGEVFVAAKAGPVGFGPYVALKVLRDELAVDRQFVEMLVDEANISMFLNHQNVVSVLDLSEDAGRYYIAMEYVQGITVERMVETLATQGRTLPVPAAMYIATELCRALKYAHTRVNHAGEPLNIVHRDVTPANILLSTQGEVKLTDFGIARARGRVHQTQAGVLKGKFGYMAPEMVRYEKIDARADLFCAGVVIYLMIAGRHPVAGAAVMEAIQRFEDKQVDRPSSLNREVPPALDTIVMRALEPKPDLRWSSAAALGDALQDVVLHNPSWRRDAKDGAKVIAQLMRSLIPDAFEEPVPRAQLGELLKRAQRHTGSMAFGSESSTASSPSARSNGATSSNDRAASGTITAREKLADAMQVHTGAGSSQNLVELDTHDVLPAISPDQNWGPTPAQNRPDIETDEELSLGKIRDAQRAIERDTDTDENDPGPDEFDDATGVDGKLPDASTQSFQALSAQPTVERAVEVLFPESSTDRNRVRDDMMAEPSLPGVSAAEADRVRRGESDKAEDGETVVGVALDEIGPDDSDDALVGAPTMAMEPVTVGHDDGKTVSGMDIPDWDAIGGGSTQGPYVYDPAMASGPDDEDAATIIPTNGPAMAALDPDVSALVDPMEWDAIASDVGDATLLDGVQASDVQAALQAQQLGQRTESAAAMLVRDESVAKDPAVVDSTLAMERIVEESVVTGPQSVVSGGPRGPQPFAGPIRIVVDDQDHPAFASSPSLDAQNAAEVLARNAAVAPGGDDLPTVSPGMKAPVMNSDVGAATGAWMAGRLDGNALEWDDDAAARRAVATRNSHGSAAQHQQHQQHQAPSPASVSYPQNAQPSRSAPPGPPLVYGNPSYPGPGGPQMAVMPERSFFARNWLVLTTVSMAIALFAGLGYAWMFTSLFWPKLKLDSTPAGAIVKVDDVQRGLTPVEVKVAPGARHLIEFSRDGHKRALREITEGIGRGRTYTLTVSLDRVSPRLVLPVEGKAFVNDQEVGVGRRIELSELPQSGEVKIRVEAEGYETYEIVFGSREEIPASLDVPLTKSPKKGRR